MSAHLVTGILTVWGWASNNAHTEGSDWYRQANHAARRLARRHGITVRQACGIIAVLSPQNGWESNLSDAETFCSTGSAPTLPLSVDKARRILLGEDPASVTAPPVGRPTSGEKVRNFFSNLVDPHSPVPVTIDRHALAVCHGTGGIDPHLLDRKGAYAQYASAYRQAALRLNVLPNVAQAVTWCAWRERYANKKIWG